MRPLYSVRIEARQELCTKSYRRHIARLQLDNDNVTIGMPLLEDFPARGQAFETTIAAGETQYLNILAVRLSYAGASEVVHQCSYDVGLNPKAGANYQFEIFNTAAGCYLESGEIEDGRLKPIDQDRLEVVYRPKCE